MKSFHKIHTLAFVCLTLLTMLSKEAVGEENTDRSFERQATEEITRAVLNMIKLWEEKSGDNLAVSEKHPIRIVFSESDFGNLPVVLANGSGNASIKADVEMKPDFEDTPNELGKAWSGPWYVVSGQYTCSGTFTLDGKRVSLSGESTVFGNDGAVNFSEGIIKVNGIEFKGKDWHTSSSEKSTKLKNSGKAEEHVVDGLDLENLYNQARDEYIRGKYDLAMQGFKSVYEKDSGGIWKEAALYWMGECLFKQNQLDQALASYQRYLQEFPRGGNMCPARFKLGYVYHQKGKAAASRFSRPKNDVAAIRIPGSMRIRAFNSERISVSVSRATIG